jgi:hypothetical protein
LYFPEVLFFGATFFAALPAFLLVFLVAFCAMIQGLHRDKAVIGFDFCLSALLMPERISSPFEM